MWWGARGPQAVMVLSMVEVVVLDWSGSGAAKLVVEEEEEEEGTPPSILVNMAIS